MSQIQAQHIMQAAQGLCGIIDILYQNELERDLEAMGQECDCLKPVTEGHLLTAAKHLAHQLNGDTESLDYYDFVKRENE